MTPQASDKRRAYVSRAVERSSAAFSSSMLSTIPPGICWTNYQWMHAQWQIANFGPVLDPSWFTLGVAEEALLELGRAVDDLDGEAADDALGDACVFLMGLCTQQRLDWGVLWAESIGYKSEYSERRGLARAVGRLCQVTLKTAQKIRGLSEPAAARMAIGGAVLDVMSQLRRETLHIGKIEDKDEVVRSVLETVLKRGSEAHGRDV